MMRMMTAAYALFAALLLTASVFDSKPAEAGGYYRDGYYRSRHHHVYGGGYRYGYRSGGYYGGRGYDGGYRTAYYDQPSYQGSGYDSDYDVGYSGTGYDGGYGTRYSDGGYRYGGYGGGYGGYGGCRTAYIPYGWRWYRASSC